MGSSFPSSHPQLVGMHHGSPQLTGNMPQLRPSLLVNNPPSAQWMNRQNMFPGDNSGIMNNMLPQHQLSHQNGLMPQQQRIPKMQVPQSRLLHPMQPHGHLPGMQPQTFNSHLSRSASSGSYDAMLGFGDQREARPGSGQRNRHNMRFPQQGFDGGLQRRNNAWPPFRSKYMTADEIENILRMQLVATHSNDPYVDDYYHQGRLAKKSAGAKLKHHFCPNHLRDLPSRARTNNEPHAYLQVDALGRVPFSSIRRPRPLLEMEPPNSNKSGNLDQKDTDKPLEQEPMLAARVIIEEGLYLFLEVDDIDRFLEFNQLPDGGNQLRQKRQALLDGLAVSLQLVDPLGKNGQNSGLASQDLVFLRITSLRKGRKLLTRYLQLLYPGSDLMRIVCMAIFRHLRSLFGVRSSDAETTKTTIKLGKVVALCIHTMDLGPVSACLAAVSCSSEHPPLRPLGSPVGDESTIILKSALDRASELLSANNYNNAGMNLWRASFDEFFNLLMKHCISKYDSIMQNLNSQLLPHFATEMSDAAAQAIVREMPIELLRASFPHISDEQKRILMEFLKPGSQKIESVVA
ncbi:PREDICTED: protein PAT1 homolog 1-like [Camelina sativa]|uniref:Protein PAT1 homolog 1-like n=1 Tax=Camelina sativa TaxID=90675 RepID=A0ABM0YA41_CAMSA|nr:PREDICTED: protein PAT1 homolog 1-like [Camelina sativa]